uniref:Vacuolar protein sorting 55 n=1 Tax=Arcella intermedia TaxID=1963864 RepID=A0A6B2LQZ2_9EUKA|eukprot:TRINITY_DN27065_c0_g1_i1.p1 TRINITY_DN27065_c0_g1~~TRINITY_DN27065_c0_g1_i1.p1  ORF type:complete len:128 (-),score=12.88 TRINITY_DN27065_c0_g1_i1:36-419(-)
MNKDFKVLFGLSFVLSVGLLLNVLACVLWHNWWPIFVVIAYFLAPLPNLICMQCGRGYEYTHGNSFQNSGYFLTGALIVSGFALPGVLAHVNIMQSEALWMGLAGGLTVYGAILTYLHCFHNKEEAI